MNKDEIWDRLQKLIEDTNNILQVLAPTDENGQARADIIQARKFLVLAQSDL